MLFQKLLNFIKKKPPLLEIALILLITLPAFISLINNKYFSMHDSQHMARLFLLDKGIKQGYLYPRWVDTLGFNYGYPLYNFYPPLIYYIGEIFHLLGFSFISSVKLVFILGFFLAAFGIYLFVKQLVGKLPAYLAAVLYTYFFYHAVCVYVRGALAEFFSMAIIPFVFWAMTVLARKINFKNAVIFGLFFGLLILNHPLIAFPFVMYLGVFFLFYTLFLKERIIFLKLFIIGIVIGLAISAFFWLPSIIEKKYTLVDNILTKELANYKIHYIYPQQFLYSPWGYGGSIKGPYDGMSFQLGKVQIYLALLSVFMAIMVFFKKNRPKKLGYFFFCFFLLLFSLYMTTFYSSFVWDNMKYLWYLQFPWRFLTFVGFFISVVAAYCIYFLQNIKFINKKFAYLIPIFIITVSVFTILRYQHYFQPKNLITTSDTNLTSFYEIAWSISRSSFEFVPKGVKTKKSNLNTTILAINPEDLPHEQFKIVKGQTLRIGGQAKVGKIKNFFADKQYNIKSSTPVLFQLNTYYFPGWKAYLNNKQIPINDNNDLKLITVEIPKGNHIVQFKFQDTSVRKVANWISTITFIFLVVYFWKVKYKQSDH